jgi:hypothetical protein
LICLSSYPVHLSFCPMVSNFIQLNPINDIHDPL